MKWNFPLDCVAFNLEPETFRFWKSIVFLESNNFFCRSGWFINIQLSKNSNLKSNLRRQWRIHFFCRLFLRNTCLAKKLNFKNWGIRRISFREPSQEKNLSLEKENQSHILMREMCFMILYMWIKKFNFCTKLFLG